MRRSALLCLAVALGPACAEPQTADLQLVLGPSECSAEQLAQISLVSIEVWGGAAEAMCTLGKRCIFDVDMPAPPTSVEDIEAAIAEVNQPLIDVEAEGARWVALLGRRQADGCFASANHPACAQADIADARDGELVLTLRCDTCSSSMEYPLCP